MLDLIIAVLSGASPYHAELRTFGQAFMGALAVRGGANKNKDMHWFHAYALTIVTAFGGGFFAFLWMGKPTSLITGGDVTLTLTAIAFAFITYLPLNMGYSIGKTLPVKIVMNTWSVFFKGLGMIGFINAAAAEVSASKYYPTPVLGPVLYGALLGNMGAFFAKGFHGHLEKGMPWPFQNALTAGFFYHLYTNDKEGFIGNTLRSVIQSTGIQGEMEDKLFATLVVTSFMQIAGLLMLPEFFGPSFNLLLLPKEILSSFLPKSGKKSAVKKSAAANKVVNGDAAAPAKAKRKSRNKKKKN